jgi:diguanylate cyclase (GGDEF)-like protein
MKNQNALLAWAAIGLSLAILASMFVSIGTVIGHSYKLGLFSFLYLVPISIALFFLSGFESILVGAAVIVTAVYSVVQPRYLAAPYANWPVEKGLYAYLVYLVGPLLKSGLLWELAAFLILCIWVGTLYDHVKKNAARAQDSLNDAQGIYNKLEQERRHFLSQAKRYDSDINRLNSLIITLSDLAKELPSVLEPDELLRLLLEKTTELFSANNCAIFNIDSASGAVVYACSAGYDQDALMNLRLFANEESGIAGWCAKNAKFLSLREVQQDPHMADLLRQNKFPLTFCQPVVQRGRSIALICVGGIKKELQDQDLMRLASLLVNLSAIAIENAQLMEKTKEQAIRDGLTGLYNHRHFYELLDETVKAMRDKDVMLGVFLIDVDYFKKFNDTHGHQIGDLILHQTAKLIQRQLQKDDIAARYGGEEFAVICPRRDGQAIKILAEDTRKAIEQATFSGHGKGLHLTISIGVAFYEPKKDAPLTISELVKHADAALYKAKEGGRNRVCFYG